MVPDQSAALEVIINLGFDRILTSGGKPDVLQGTPRLKDLVNQVLKIARVLMCIYIVDTIERFDWIWVWLLVSRVKVHGAKVR